MPLPLVPVSIKNGIITNKIGDYDVTDSPGIQKQGAGIDLPGKPYRGVCHGDSSLQRDGFVQRLEAVAESRTGRRHYQPPGGAEATLFLQP